jgi:hypothetical protein
MNLVYDAVIGSKGYSVLDEYDWVFLFVSRARHVVETVSTTSKDACVTFRVKLHRISDLLYEITD